ncbi:MAG: T9SS type A sorting domain-containing protein [Saprospiraceae bacterium]|nr:T9SS type A sorting domain-containing protein [Saprospiraceae bacterium]
MFKKLILLSVFFIVQSFQFVQINFAQDTIWTKVFNYNSKTRDTLVQFPAGDHNQYEKILMYYSMRCKKGLVSTSTNRNLGCGEWDYSCNTNVIDSSGTDSLKATHPNYIINGYSENFFPYLSSPTYTLHQFPAKNLTIQSSSNLSLINVGNTGSASFFSVQDNKSIKAYYIFNKSELNGLPAGNIQGLRLNAQGMGEIDHFTCRIAKMTDDDFELENLKNLVYSTVVERKIKGEDGTIDLIFQKPFSYNLSNHIIIEVTYFGNEKRINDLAFEFETTTVKSSYANNNDHFLELGSQGTAKLPAEPMKNIKKEISISFWSRGNEDILPNNNSIFYATDSAGNRQLNVHLPWSNGRVFWDCGYGGGSTDRIDKAAIPAEYEGQWNHWVFTKNTNTGNMKIYLNGTLWHSSGGKTKEIKIDQFFLGGSNSGDLLYSGDIDDFCVWNKELSLDEILKIMQENPSDEGPLRNFLMAHYDMNNKEENIIIDKSPYQQSAQFEEKVNRKRFSVSEIFKGYSQTMTRPKVSFIKGNYNFTSEDGISTDSIQNSFYKVTEYSVQDNSLIKGNVQYLWLAGMYPVYNENLEIIDQIEYAEEDIIIIEPLTYYRKFPAKYELLSFVTPYGIGLDFGQGGKTWVFDVTDYGPVLKDAKRFLMDKGGEWQEEMDIKFAFIKGIPPRQVLSVQQIWPADAYGFTSILSNQQLEPRTITYKPEVKSMKIRTVATGHGQEGEFIPRTHSLLVNNTNFSWQLWKECADNPVYPQGGTWVHDRAGWCPGAPSDLREFEIMNLVANNSSFTVDYGLNTAAGDSRYIVNTQLVKYGQINFDNDVAIEEIVSPSYSAVHYRKNPVCSNPEIVIKNTGKTLLTKATIAYMVEGYAKRTFQWNGNLDFMKTTNVILPTLSGKELRDGGIFKVWIENINETNDEYPKNNQLESVFGKTPFLEDGIIVSMRTNSAPNETSWTLKDESGNMVKQSRNGLIGNTMYNDTIVNLNGCYKLQFYDSGDDGISWWANGDGNGIIRAKGIKEDIFSVFQPDFGREYTFNFAAGNITSVEDFQPGFDMKISPNPIVDELNIFIKRSEKNAKISIITQDGKEIMHQSLDKEDEERKFSFNLTEYPSGLYLVKYSDVKNRTIKKFIKI